MGGNYINKYVKDSIALVTMDGLCFLHQVNVGKSTIYHSGDLVGSFSQSSQHRRGKRQSVGHPLAASSHLLSLTLPIRPIGLSQKLDHLPI